MWVAHAAVLFLCQALWQWTGLAWAGQVLVRALGSPNANVRTIAGMFLVRAGRRAGPLLEDAMRRRENLPMLLAIMGDIGDPQVESELRSFAQDHDPEIAQAARDALQVLAAHR
jgi:hypothetical protein